MSWFDPKEQYWAMPDSFQKTDFSDIESALRWAYSVLCVTFFVFEHADANQSRQCARSSTGNCISMHQSKVPTVRCQYVCWRSAPHSYQKCEYHVRQPNDAKRNSCDETCWCDHLCYYANRAQRSTLNSCSWMEFNDIGTQFTFTVRHSPSKN